MSWRTKQRNRKGRNIYNFVFPFPGAKMIYRDCIELTERRRDLQPSRLTSQFAPQPNTRRRFSYHLFTLLCVPLMTPSQSFRIFMVELRCNRPFLLDIRTPNAVSTSSWIGTMPYRALLSVGSCMHMLYDASNLLLLVVVCVQVLVIWWYQYL